MAALEIAWVAAAAAMVLDNPGVGEEGPALFQDQVEEELVVCDGTVSAEVELQLVAEVLPRVHLSMKVGEKAEVAESTTRSVYENELGRGHPDKTASFLTDSSIWMMIAENVFVSCHL